MWSNETISSQAETSEIPMFSSTLNKENKGGKGKKIKKENKTQKFQGDSPIQPA